MKLCAKPRRARRCPPFSSRVATALDVVSSVNPGASQSSAGSSVRFAIATVVATAVDGARWTATRARAPSLRRSIASTCACFARSRSARHYWRRQTPRWCFDRGRAGGWQRRAVRDVAAAAASANSEPSRAPGERTTPGLLGGSRLSRARDAMALVVERLSWPVRPPRSRCGDYRSAAW